MSLQFASMEKVPSHSENDLMGFSFHVRYAPQRPTAWGLSDFRRNSVISNSINWPPISVIARVTGATDDNKQTLGFHKAFHNAFRSKDI